MSIIACLCYYRLGVIIEVTGAATYHGFLPSLVRDCVAAITSAGRSLPSPIYTSIISPFSLSLPSLSTLPHSLPPSFPIPSSPSLTGPDGITPNYPLSFATALFSFLYHLATYEASQ